MNDIEIVADMFGINSLLKSEIEGHYNCFIKSYKDKDYQAASEYIMLAIQCFHKDDAIPRQLKQTVYYAAGQLYAILGEEQQSLEFFQRMQYYASNLSRHSSFTTRKEVVVYSFRRFSTYSLSDLINNQITVVHSSLMNDPFDSVANFWCVPSRLQQYCGEHRHLSQLSKSFDYFKIRSFVANIDTYRKDDTVVQKILMWSHYAESHTGFCVRYKLSDFFIKKEKDDAYAHHYLKPVEYVPEYVIDSKSRSLSSDDAYVKKSLIWRDENELRLVCYNPDVSSHYLGIPLDELSKVEAIY